MTKNFTSLSLFSVFCFLSSFLYIICFDSKKSKRSQKDDDDFESELSSSSSSSGEELQEEYDEDGYKIGDAKDVQWLQSLPEVQRGLP